MNLARHLLPSAQMLLFKTQLIIPLLVVAAFFSGCKRTFSGTNTADGRGDTFAKLDDGVLLLCDCGSLLPFGERPAYPRAHPIEGGARCAYDAAGASSGAGSLIVAVRKGSKAAHLDEALRGVTAAYAKVASTTRTAIAPGEAVVSRAVGALGTDVVAGVYMEKAQMMILTEEHLADGKVPESGEATMLTTLAALALGSEKACR